MFHRHFPVTITLDTGVESCMIKHFFAKYIDAPIMKTNQHATQADGVTPLDIIGETHIRLCRGAFEFQLDSLVVADQDVDILGGVTIMAAYTTVKLSITAQPLIPILNTECAVPKFPS